MAEAPAETVEATPARASRWRRIAADTTPLKESADYRRWWLGYSLSFTGTQLTQFAIPLQVYAITKSSFYVGLVGLVVVGPLVVMGLLGGAIADAVDRRRLTLVTGTALMLLSVGLRCSQRPECTRCGRSISLPACRVRSRRQTPRPVARSSRGWC